MDAVWYGGDGVNIVFGWMALVALGMAAAPAMAQSSGGLFGREGKHFGSGPSAPPSHTKPAPQQPSTLKPDPRQRLDAGALLCATEADLQQHEAAVAAQLDGKYAPEPVGCRPVRYMTAVGVISRRGPGRTQVRIPGPPERIGWTDAAVRDAS